MLSFLKEIVYPSTWMQNHRYNKAFNSWLNKALDNPVFSSKTPFTVKLNGKELWIANRPYASPHPYILSRGGDIRIRASRATIRKFFKAYDEKYPRQYNNKNKALKEWLMGDGSD